MFYFIFHFFLIFITVAADANNLKVVTYDNSVNVIVKDLIENWESPFAYLKCRGYLSKDLQAAPDLEDFQQQLQESSGQEWPLYKESKRELAKKENECDSRAVRSPEVSKNQEMKQMFQQFFSTNNKTASEKIKSKLNVNWNMDSLKSSVSESVSKYMKEKEDLIVNVRNKVTNDIPSLNVQGPLTKDPIVKDPLDMESLAKEAQRKVLMFKNTLVKDALDMEALDKGPIDKETLAKENFFKKHFFKDAPEATPLAVPEPAPVAAERKANPEPAPVEQAPVAVIPTSAPALQAKKDFFKKPLLEEQLLFEPVVKPNSNFENPKFLNSLAKALTSSEMRRKNKPANQENSGISNFRW